MWKRQKVASILKSNWGNNTKYSFVKDKSGIGLTEDKQTIVLMQDGKSKAYDVSDIRSLRTSLESAEFVTPMRSDAGMASSAAGRNIGLGMQARRNSGLFIQVKDIDYPEWRINMLRKEDQ